MDKLKELYEKLVEHYSSLYVMPTAYLERRITELQKLGYSREEAILKIYKEVFGEVEVKVKRTKLEKVEKYEIKVTKYSILNLLSYSYNAYTHNPCLVLPVLFKDSINYISSALIFIIALYALNEAFRLGISLNLGELSKVKRLLTILQENLHIVIIISVLLFCGLILVRVAASSIYWLTIISGSLKLYKHRKVTLKDIVSSFKLFSKVFKAVLVAEFIRVSGLIVMLIPFTYILTNLKSLLEYPLSFLVIVLTVLLVFLISILVYLILFTLTIYVPHEVVISNKGTLAAISGSYKIFKKSWLEVALYVILWLATLFCTGILSGIFELIHISLRTLMSFIVMAIVTPILDISLTGVYLQYVGQEIELWSKPRKILKVLTKYIWYSLNELLNFIKKLENIPFIMIAIVIFIAFYTLGIHLGNTQFTPLMSRIVRPGELSPLIERILPFSLALEIFFNNWKVVIISSLGGIFYVIPPLVTSLNGLVLGLVASKLKLIEFLVLIMPHGCIELPTFILAIAVGIRFSFVTISKRANVSEALRETILIAIGLAIPLIIAAFIEAFITPQLARILLGWN